ncbi:hypothetical protein [Longimicrobium terrae]|uniref:Uncharacterized protein n=1 Tax=Longimicrobium terrae TaxID=1639882 RepID=A0A841H3S4_9BACT|nr:hypothetical protein [Longimicrobium terrae]MBB4638309.1 hypothetical protein [Longimicrobium terrae]MBB6072623.1 hypothetical protein [Longimicrobium terrae]NNC28598.1 hypothetical protein [Longimicrobium terrae]
MTAIVVRDPSITVRRSDPHPATNRSTIRHRWTTGTNHHPPPPVILIDPPHLPDARALQRV